MSMKIVPKRYLFGILMLLNSTILHYRKSSDRQNETVHGGLFLQRPNKKIKQKNLRISNLR